MGCLDPRRESGGWGLVLQGCGRGWDSLPARSDTEGHPLGPSTAASVGGALLVECVPETGLDVLLASALRGHPAGRSPGFPSLSALSLQLVLKHRSPRHRVKVSREEERVWLREESTCAACTCAHAHGVFLSKTLGATRRDGTKASHCQAQGADGQG